MTGRVHGVFQEGHGGVLHLPSDLQHRVRQARQFVRDAIAPCERATEDAAGLLTSEVVANAIVHAGGEVALRVRCDGARALVEVHDDGAELPERRQVHAARPGGYGMQIIDALADSWGVTQVPGDGKIVWFEIAL
jgi:anti-sigma regulatory factor (Ser/Thr protein kinase)